MIFIRNVFLLLFFCGLFIEVTIAQNTDFGIPFVNNYDKTQYNAGTQNWDVIQDNADFLYFANNEGMLQFDGDNWELYPLPNKTIVRSLALGLNGNIYVGGQNEFGYFKSTESSSLIYVSLKKLIPLKYQNFDDVWDIAVSDNGVFFRTITNLYRYYDNKIYVYNTEGSFTFLGKVNNEILVNVNTEGLKVFKNSEFEFIPNTQDLAEKIITKIIYTDDNSWLIATVNQGFYRFSKQVLSKHKTGADKLLYKYKINAVVKSADNYLIIGTSTGGLIKLDNKGQLVFVFQKENGLLNNKILSLCIDRQDQLWLGLDNGIDYVKINSAYSQIFPNKKLKGQAFDVKIINNDIYFATSNGVFYSEMNSKPVGGSLQYFELDELKGQAWGFDIVDDNILLGHHEGAYMISGKDKNSITDGFGYWLFQKTIKDKNKLLVGTYTGIEIFIKDGNSWEFSHKIKNFNESSRFIEQDLNGDIWIAHPYKGVFRLTPKNGYEDVIVDRFLYVDKEKSNQLKYVFSIMGELIFCAQEGIFVFDKKTQTFILHVEFTELFGSKVQMRRLFEGVDGSIWYVTDESAGVIEIKNKSLEKVVLKRPFPELKDYLVGGFELIYPYDKNNVFVAAQEGFLHLDLTKVKKSYNDFKVGIRKIIVTGQKDSIVYNGSKTITQKENIPEFIFNENNFNFSFRNNDYLSNEFVKYSFYLEGFREEWSDWSPKTFKEYNYLKPGKYTFYLRGENKLSDRSNEVKYTFIIKSPWYSSNTAIGLYVVLFSIFNGLLIRFLRKKYSYQKTKVISTTKEVEKLKNEKHSNEMAFKNKELISISMHLAHKNEILEEIKTNIIAISVQSKEKETKRQLGIVKRAIEREENSDENWERFIAHFNEIHDGFFDKLREYCPSLSSKDLKLCSFLKMNLTTKDIASLMNVSIRGVEGGRYRLRKKLEIGKNENLSDFIMKI